MSVKLTKGQDEFLCSMLGATNGHNTVKILFDLQNLIVEREAHIRRDQIIKTTEDCSKTLLEEFQRIENGG